MFWWFWKKIPPLPLHDDRCLLQQGWRQDMNWLVMDGSISTRFQKFLGADFTQQKITKQETFLLKRLKKKILFVTLLLRVLLHIIITIFMLMFLLPQLFEKKCFLCTKKHLLLILQILHLWQRFKSSNETSAHIGQEKTVNDIFQNWALSFSFRKESEYLVICQISLLFPSNSTCSKLNVIGYWFHEKKKEIDLLLFSSKSNNC